MKTESRKLAEEERKGRRKKIEAKYRHQGNRS